MCPHTDLTVIEFLSLTSPFLYLHSLSFDLNFCGVAAAFREERGSVLEPLMTFLTGLTVVSVAPEGEQKVVGQLCAGSGGEYY